jgi:LCP family protein required for cell wall assembly
VNTNSLSYRLLITFIVLSILVVGGVLAWQGMRLIGVRAMSPTPFVPTRAAVASVPINSTSIPGEASVKSASPTPSPQPSATLHLSATPGASPTPSGTPTIAPTPTRTPIPSLTPTSLPQQAPTLSVTEAGEAAEGSPTPATAIPTPVPTYEVPRDTTNVLLLGSDTPLGTKESRSDTMIIVAINRSGPTASMISLPRDLYVYLPGKFMNRLNTAYSTGGVELLKQTILYNFGIPIHYYARIDFEGFKSVIDAIDGVDINVSCGMEDWRLKSPELDPLVEENWERFNLEPGAYHMDGDLALWFARSRLATSDFDRGRRQQQLLRALLNQGVDLGLVAQVPTLWNAYQESIDTDIDIGRLLQFAALAPAIRENGVQHLYLASKTEPWVVPTTGAYVHLPIWEGSGMMEETLRRLFFPPALDRATRPPIPVEVINITDNPDLSLLAADNLAWYGFIPTYDVTQPTPQMREDRSTRLTYFGPNFKGSYDWLISWIFGVRRSQIELVSDEPSYPYKYQVIIGDDYDPCVDQFYAPQAFLSE